MEEELAAIQEVCDEVERLGRLEGVVKLDNERMRDLLHDVALNLRVIHLVGLDDEVLFERLDRVDLPCILLLRHVHLAKATAPNDLEQLEIFDGHRGLVARGRAVSVENFGTRLKT